MTQGESSGFLSQSAAAIAGFSVRRPRLVLSVALILVVVSLVAASRYLHYKAQRNDLISPEKTCQKRWQRVLDAFGEDDDCVFVIRGHDERRMIDAADTLAARLRAKPDCFDRVFHCVDLRGLQSRSLQFATCEEIRRIDRQLDDLAPLLGSFSTVGWHSLSLETLLAKSLASNDAALHLAMPQVLNAAAIAIDTPEVAISPWGPPRVIDSRLSEPQYFFTPDRSMLMVLARPKCPDAKQACEEARRIIRSMRAEEPDLEFGLTGLPVLEADEMAASEADSARASWLALAGVALLYLIAYRGLRYPALTLSTLLAGTALALGWATLTIGHLNILSAAFAVMIIGLGDYGVIWVAHYDDQRRLGFDVIQATARTAAGAGPGIAVAAAISALAFAATMLADFQAVIELGWIAGWGLLFCMAACFTVLPALLAITERQRALAPQSILRIPVESRPFLPSFSARPRLVLAVAVLALLGVLGGLHRVRYDSNLLHLQSEGLESVAWERELIGRAAGATWDAVSFASTREEALRLKAAYEANPEVSRVVEAASLTVTDFESKRAHLESIQRKLAGLPQVVPDFTISSSAVVSNLAQRLGTPESQALANSIDALPAAEAARRLRNFDRRLRSTLHANLLLLRTISRPERIIMDDIPPAFRERTIAPNGQFLIRAFARDSLWDQPALERFTAAAAAVDPEATGKSFRTLEGLEQMKSGFLRAAAAALIVIIVVLSLDFRSMPFVLLGLLPLALGLITTLGIVGWLGLPLNPANLIALPLIVGVGVDNGVHVLHDFRTRRGHYQLRSSTGRGIAVAALTTILGFGSLIIARHRGMASLGAVLAIGVTACLVASLIILPAILHLLSKTNSQIITIRLSTKKPTRAAA